MRQTTEELTAEAFEQGRVFGRQTMKEEVVKTIDQLYHEGDALIVDGSKVNVLDSDVEDYIKSLKTKLERMQ